MADGHQPARRPAMPAVDDQPQVLRAVEADLPGRHGDRYRILRSQDGASALDTRRRSCCARRTSR